MNTSRPPVPSPGEAAERLTISSLTGGADRAAVLIAAVVAETDLARWLVEVEAHRQRILRARFGLLVEHAFEYGRVDVAIGEDGQWRGVGVWLDRTRPLPAPIGYEAHLERVAGDHLPRLTAWDKALAEHVPARGHHALVAAAAWGESGTGSALLAAGLDRADQAGVAVHAIAPTAASRGLCEQHGYRQAAQFRPAEGGPRLWSMLRPAPRRPRRRP